VAPDEPVPPTPPTPPAPPPATATPASGTPSGPADPDALRERVIDVLRDTFDPEIPVNVYELGLVYGIDVAAEGKVVVRMTLTSPACPVAGSLPGEVQAKIAALAGVTSAQVDLVWDPPWDPSKLSDAARLQLGMY
jgi:FeS assembly SUF system protein